VRKTESRPIASLTGSSSRFGPQVARAYLEVLDERMKAVKEALHDGFGVMPSRVVQTSYEPSQYDETGMLCGAQPTLGMDVHPGLKISRQRLQETGDFLRDFLGRLECITGGKNRTGCAANLATGAGTGFTLVTDHIPEFSRRGLCRCKCMIVGVGSCHTRDRRTKRARLSGSGPR